MSEGRGSRTKNLVWAAVVVVLLAVGGIGLAGALQGLDLGAAAGAGSTGGAAGTPGARPGTAAPATSAPAAPAPTPSPARSLSRFDPGASPTENLGVFTRTLEGAARSASSSSVDASTLTGALAAAGFAPSAMQRSADQTSANLQAPVLTVSVRVGADCLVGQFVRSDASISTELATPVAQGACLIGRQPKA
ncbi:DUF6993 domain-containing protein [Sinomonas atrocyanea]